MYLKHCECPSAANAPLFIHVELQVGGAAGLKMVSEGIALRFGPLYVVTKQAH